MNLVDKRLTDIESRLARLEEQFHTVMWKPTLVVGKSPAEECEHLWNGTLKGRRCIYCGLEELIGKPPAGCNRKPSVCEPPAEECKPGYYAKGKSGGNYTAGVDPEVTCPNCNKTFLCDPMDHTCRICGKPLSKKEAEPPKPDTITISRQIAEMIVVGSPASQRMDEWWDAVHELIDEVRRSLGEKEGACSK